MIIDASVLLRAFFPDEAQEQVQCLIAAHVGGEITLQAPALLTYGTSNAIWQAEHRERITTTQADQILVAMEGLRIHLHSVSWAKMFLFAQRSGGWYSFQTP